MQKSQPILKNLVKKQSKPEQNLKVPTASYSLNFPIGSYLKSFSNHEDSPQTEDLISEGDDSEFQTSQKRSTKRKSKSSKSVKNKNSTKKPPAKVKKDEVKHEKSEKPLKHSDGTNFQHLRQDLPIGIDNSGPISPISEAAYLKLAKKIRRNPKPKKLKVQAKQQELKAKNQEQEQMQPKDQLQANVQTNIQEYQKQEIDYLTSISEFHIVDFKYHHKKEDFKVERDVFFVFVPKRIKRGDKENDVPKQLILKGQQVCENRELFGELMRFYRGLLRDAVQVKECINE